MASKKRDAKSKKAEADLNGQDPREIEMILDRLSVQNPEGESFRNYLQSLSNALAGREILVSLLIEKLSRHPSDVGFQAFLTLKNLVESAKYRRAIKQAAYRFSQRGYAVETDAVSEEKVVLIPKEARKPIAHLIVSPETFWLVSVLVPESGYPSSFAISAFPEEGFRGLSARVVESSQRLYREFIQNVGSHVSQKPIEIPVWHAARLFFDLLGFCGSGGGISAEVERARNVLEPFHDPQKQPLAFELMPPLDDPGRHLREVNVKGLMEAVVSKWLYFPKSDLQPYWEKIRELERPVLVVPPGIQRERTLDAIGKAADELCVGNTRLLYRRFFEEQALSMKLSSEEDLAMSAWIVAQHLGSESRPGENPVISDLVVLSMKEYWPKEFEDAENHEDEEPFERTESGIILPK